MTWLEKIHRAYIYVCIIWYVQNKWNAFYYLIKIHSKHIDRITKHGQVCFPRWLFTAWPSQTLRSGHWPVWCSIWLPCMYIALHHTSCEVFCDACGVLIVVLLGCNVPLGVPLITGYLLPPLMPSTPLISTTPDTTAVPLKAIQNLAW